MVDGVETLARIIMRRPEVQLTFVASGVLLTLVVLAVARRGDWSPLRTVAGVLAGFALAVLPATTLPRGSGHPLSWPWESGGCALALKLTTVTPEVLLNTVMLVPFGFLGVLAFRSVASVLGAALVGSVGIEVIQTLTGRGTCQASDLVHNMLGASVGAAVAAVLLWVRRNHLPE